MKNFQSLFIYLLAAVCAWVLTGTRGCEANSAAPGAPASIVVHDTTTRWELYPVEKIHTMMLRETVYVERPTQYVPGGDRDTADVLLVAADAGDSLRLYAGEVSGERCSYRYVAGVHSDSLHFLSLESSCQEGVPPAFTLAGDRPAAITHRTGVRRGLNVGLKAGWVLHGDISHVGAQVAWRGAYGAVNHLPGTRQWMFEAGFLWPLRQSAQPGN